MRIILLGPPGAGKGTQAKVLAQKLNLPHISTGEILRQNTVKGTELGNKAKDFMNQGALVPDELVSSMLLQRIDEPDAKNGFILDGYPRNLSQAKTLDQLLCARKIDINLVAYLETSVSVVVQRLSGRLVCKKCGVNYHKTNMPPTKEGICDNCGGQLYQRSDDNEKTILARLEVYNKESKDLINYYDKKHKLHRVNADQDSEIVLNKLVWLAQHSNDPVKV